MKMNTRNTNVPTSRTAMLIFVFINANLFNGQCLEDVSIGGNFINIDPWKQFLRDAID